MKLSCSAYQAGSSYAQKILTNHPQNYGSTSSTTGSGDGSHGIMMPTWNVEEIEGKCSPNETTEFGADNGYQEQGGSSGGGGASRPSDAGTSRRSSSFSEGNPDQRGNQSDTTSISKAPATSSCSPSDSPAHRSKSNQRWMKLRTTVQLSGAIQTIQQKKAPLKREDSFLKRFSTRQIPEAQETFEIGDDDGISGGGGEWSKKTRKKRRSLPRSVVNPDGQFYFYWLMILTSCVLYNLWTLIVRQSFPELQADIKLFWILSDAFSDLVFLLDIAVQFRTGYLEQGLMVYQTRKLAAHYVGSKPFYLDLFSLLPTDLFQIYFGVNPMFRFPRFLKVYRIYNYYYMVESRTVYPNVWRVVNLIHILLLLAHWFGCFYYLISEAEGFQGHWGYPNPNKFEEFTPLSRKYLGSLYWSTLTLTTIGDLPPPNSDSQYIFTIVSYLIGVFIFATIVGQVGNVITNRNANRLEFERLLDGAKMYMRHHKVPRDMQRRVLRWYDYSWSRGRIQGGGDINTALGLLPDKLKTELALHVNLSVLKKVTIFQECQPEFLHDLVLKMKAYIFTPGDLICRKGEVAREMFIIADGILEVISETGKVLTTMQAGDFFGEIGILNLDGLNKRTADVRSVGYSELFSLSREDVLAAMKDYPEAQEILQTLGRKRLMEARKANSGPPKKVPGPVQGQGPTSPIRGLSQSGSTHSHKELVETDSNAGKRIVEKLKSDVKGLRNAIRKSRRSNSSKEDSSEPESGLPDEGSQKMKRKESTASVSTKSFPPPRGVLKRMHNVVLSDEKEPSSPPHTQGPGKKVQLGEPEVIGAGLPLMQRLRLLRQKEEREKKVEEEREALRKSLIPVTVLQTTKATVESEQSQGQPGTPPAYPLLGTFPKSSPMLIGEAAAAAVLKVTGPSEQSPAAALSFPPVWTASPPRTTQVQVPTGSPLTSSTAEAKEVEKERPSALYLQRGQLQASGKNYGSVDDLSPEFSRLPFIKKLKILNERQKIAELLLTKSGNSVLTRSTSEGSNETGREGEPVGEPLYALHLGRRSQSNREGVGDPAETSAGAPPYFPLTESHDFMDENNKDEEVKGGSESGSSSSKEAKDKEGRKRRRRRRKLELETGDGHEGGTESTSSSPSSDGETPERRNLKSILKQLAEQLGEEGSGSEALLRAETPEGFAARHHPSCHLVLKETTTTTMTMTATTTAVAGTMKGKGEEGRRADQDSGRATTAAATLPQSLPPEELRLAQEECVGSVVFGIKTIIQSKMDEIQETFQTRFDTLEKEVRRRDAVISVLQERIQELEERGTRPLENHIGSCEEDDDDDEQLEYERSHSTPHMTTTPFARGDSIDTVISAQDFEDEVFERDEEFRHEATATRFSTFQKDDLEEGEDEGPAPWELEFHRDKDSLPPPNGRSEAKGEVRVDIESSSSSTEEEEDSAPDNLKIPLSEEKVPLDEDEEEEEEEEEDDEEASTLGLKPLDNKNWELTLLAKEMERREETTKRGSVVHQMLQLESEIEEMKEVVSKGALSPSDLDMLESILETKTKKMRALYKALSTEEEEKTRGEERRGEHSAGRLRRQASLYEGNKGQGFGQGQGSRRESAGAIHLPEQKRKGSFLTRLNTLTRQFTLKGKEDVGSTAGGIQLEEIPTPVATTASASSSTAAAPSQEESQPLLKKAL